MRASALSTHEQQRLLVHARSIVCESSFVRACRGSILGEAAAGDRVPSLAPELAAYAAALARSVLASCCGAQEMSTCIVRSLDDMARSAMRLHEASCQVPYLQHCDTHG